MSEELTYLQKLEKDYLRIEAENETLSSALRDARHEIRVLKNKAEQVQELEQQQLKNDDYTWKLLMEIKRYRDVIEIAIHNMKGCSDLGTVFALNELERVLEGAE